MCGVYKTKQLRPFVFTGTAKEGGLPQRSQPGYLDASWLYPDHKSEEATDVAHPRLNELQGVPAFERGRFNPRFYAALSDTVREKRAARATGSSSGTGGTGGSKTTTQEGKKNGMFGGRFGLK